MRRSPIRDSGESIFNPVPIRFEILAARHSVAPFDCGNAKITDWLREQALAQRVAGKYATYVAVEEETGSEMIVGYFAVRADYILYPPTRGSTYRHVVPVVEIAYLGRDRRWKRREIGIRLVLEALRVALEAHESLGGFAGVHLTTTDKGRHLYIDPRIAFGPHPAGNTADDYYKPMQDVRALLRVDETSPAIDGTMTP